MSSEDTTRQQGMSSGAKIAIGVVILAIIIVALFFLLKGNTTTTKTKGTDYADSSSLSCTASNIDNGTFDTRGADYTSYDLSIIFHDDAIYNLMYTFNGVYPSHDSAVTAEAVIHAAFNTSLSNSGVYSAEAFASDNWNVSDNEVKFSVLADSEDITVATADELMLDVEDPDSANPKIPNTLKEVKANYNKRGFICKEQN